jgi:branched-chain amino acid transport system permease protein
MSVRRLLTPGNLLVAIVVAVLFLMPSFSPTFLIYNVMTEALILGLIAATVVFLTSYVGMISLAQLLLAGIAGFMFGNAALEDSARGLNLGWSPWVAVTFALGVTALVAFLLGALGSRTTGIYFLMLTLVYGVIGYSVFAQVVTISGPGGLARIVAPAPFNDKLTLYYAALWLSALAYLAFRAIGRTNFGLALQEFATIPFGWDRWASTSPCSGRWPSRWPGSSPALQASSTCGGAHRSTRRRSRSAPP